MSASIVLACLWGLIANVLGMIPSRDNHWRRAYWLIAAGVPIVAMVFYQHGAMWGGIVLAAGAWILRWPVYYLGRWLRDRVLRRSS